MTGAAESARAVVRLAFWAQLFLFSLNLAWMVIWCERVRGPTWFYRLFWSHAHWPVRILGWRFWMPEPPTVLGQVLLSFSLGMSLFLILLLVAHLQAARAVLRAVPQSVAIVGYPLFAIYLNGFYFDSPRIAGREFWLTLETVAVLAGGVLYYLRKWPVRWTVGALLLMLHFSLWAWETRSYASLLAEIGAYPPWKGLLGLQVGFGICISMFFHYGFPAIGFLSALVSGLYLKLAFDSAPRATH